MRRAASNLQETTEIVTPYNRVDRSLLVWREQSTRFLILFAFWFGLATGLVEVGIVTLEKLYLYPMMRLSRDFVWMAPVAEVSLLLLVTLPLILVGRLWRKLDLLPIVLFICSLLAFLNLLMLVPRLHHLAALLLAAGLAVQVARYSTARAAAFRAVVKRTLFWMIGIVFLLAVGIQARQAFAERQALAMLPPARQDAPNVVVITLDTVRAANLSLYGYPRLTTPRLEQLAKTGVVFERALSTAPWTLPSHASMFTGRWPHELSADYATPLDETHATLAEFLRNRGYVTAGFVANYGYCSYETGLNRGFIHYEDYPKSLGEIVSSSTLTRTIANNFRLRRLIENDEHLNRKSAAEINDAVLDWLSRNRERPIFVFMNYFDAHEPYLPPAPFDQMFGPGRKLGKYSPLHRWLWEPSVAHENMHEENIREERDSYDGAIAYLDHHLGFFFDELNRKNLLNNTVIIVTSDHGEEFGEHGVFEHGYSLYLPSVHVPLLILFPGRVPAGLRVHHPVSLRDLPATIVDLLEFKHDSTFPGRSLARYWGSNSQQESADEEPLLSEVDYATGHPVWFPISKGNMKSLVYQRMRYIKNGDGVEELYDFYQDPWERQNRAQSDENSESRRQFQVLLKNSVR
jgi:arylsulfatase A-like enzyme